MKSTMLYNTATGKMELWSVEDAKNTWRVAWKRLMAFLRRVRRSRPKLPKTYELDPVTLDMRDPKMERRQRRRGRRDRLIANAAKAINSMIQMQKYLN